MRLAIALVGLMAFGGLTACSSSGSGPSGPENEESELVVRARSAGSFPSPAAAQAVLGRVDPDSYVATFYRFYLASNADCTSPVLLSNRDTSPVVEDLLSDPTLFTVTSTPGTYDCIVMRISDVFSFVPATTLGPCVAGTTYQVDTYYDGETDFRTVDGSSITGSGTDAAPVDNMVDIFFTTNPAAVEARGYSSNQIVPLESGAVVPGTSTFVYDVTDQVVAYDDGQCRSAGGTYTFR